MKNFETTLFNKNFTSGYVAIIGSPNVGKSTLLNFILKKKISITSKKPQTTRIPILGITTNLSSQIIFIDTAGINNNKKIFDNRIEKLTLKSIKKSDLILLIIDITNFQFSNEKILINKIKKSKKPILIAINKIDISNTKHILNAYKKLSKIIKPQNIITISATKGFKVKELTKNIEKMLPFGLPLLPKEKYTNMSDTFLISEIIREKILRLTGQEIPYSSAITIEYFKENKKKFEIYADIHVEKISQKKIIIGKKAKKLTQIGEKSRIEIKKFLKKNIFLKLFVKVQKNWRKNIKKLEKLGY